MKFELISEKSKRLIMTLFGMTTITITNNHIRI